MLENSVTQIYSDLRCGLGMPVANRSTSSTMPSCYILLYLALRSISAKIWPPDRRASCTSWWLLLRSPQSFRTSLPWASPLLLSKEKKKTRKHRILDTVWKNHPMLLVFWSTCFETSTKNPTCQSMFRETSNIWVWVKIRYPNNWMVNTKLD